MFTSVEDNCHHLIRYECINMEIKTVFVAKICRLKIR